MSSFENLVTEGIEPIPEVKRPVGRPQKGYEDFHCQLPGEFKSKIQQLAEILDCSQGEIVAAAVKCYLQSFKKPY